MSQVQGGMRPQMKPPSDIYTVLVAIAVVALVAAAGVTAWKNMQMAGQNPFQVVSEDTIE